MARNGKVQVFKIGSSDGEVRLIKGTLKQVEEKLRGEVEIEPCSLDDARKYHETVIEDATGEP